MTPSIVTFCLLAHDVGYRRESERARQRDTGEFVPHGNISEVDGGMRARYLRSDYALGSEGAERRLTVADFQYPELDWLMRTGQLYTLGHSVPQEPMRVISYADLMPKYQAYQRVAAYDSPANWENHYKGREFAMLMGLMALYESMDLTFDDDGTLLYEYASMKPVYWSLGNSDERRCFGFSMLCILLNGGSVALTAKNIAEAYKYTPACHRECQGAGLTAPSIAVVELPGIVPPRADGSAAFQKRRFKNRGADYTAPYGAQRNGVGELPAGGHFMDHIDTERLLNTIQYVAVKLCGPVYPACMLPVELQKFKCRQPLARLTTQQCHAIRWIIDMDSSKAGSSAKQCGGDNCNYGVVQPLYVDLLRTGTCACVQTDGRNHCRHLD